MKDVLRISGSLLVSCLMGVTLLNCSSGASTSTSGGSTPDSTVLLTTIDELPSSLAPVEDSSSSSLSLAKGPLFELAATGQPLGSDPLGDGLITTETSLAACEAFNMSKSAINQAAMGDQILCYVQTIFAAADDGTIDIYDGEYHTFGLDFGAEADSEEGGGPDKVRFKIVKDENEVITDFVMYACSDGEQDEYLSQSIGGESGSDFAMTNLGVHNNTTGNWSWSSGVDGTLDANGSFIDTKTIDISFDSTWLSDGDEVGNGNGNIVFAQGSDSAALTGFMSGGNTFNGETFTFENQFVGALQLLDGNAADADPYDIRLLALGSGCVNGVVTGGAVDCAECASQEWEESYTECWDGDTMLAEADNDFLDDVENATMPTVTGQTVAFSGDQSYACDGEVERTLVLADLNVDFETECESRALNHEHIDCWQTIQSGGEGGGGSGGSADLSGFNISSCNGSPAGTATLNQTTGTQLCTCLEGIYGVGSIPCDEFGTLCGGGMTVNACVTVLKSQ